MTVRQTAELLAVDRRTVRAFLKEGALSSRVVVLGGRATHLIPRADVEALLKQRRQAADAQVGKKGRPIVLPGQEGAEDA